MPPKMKSSSPSTLARHRTHFDIRRMEVQRYYQSTIVREAITHGQPPDYVPHQHSRQGLVPNRVTCVPGSYMILLVPSAGANNQPQRSQTSSNGYPSRFQGLQRESILLEFQGQTFKRRTLNQSTKGSHELCVSIVQLALALLLALLFFFQRIYSEGRRFRPII